MTKLPFDYTAHRTKVRKILDATPIETVFLLGLILSLVILATMGRPSFVIGF